MDEDVTGLLIDTALLGAVYEHGRRLPRAIEMARTVCQPWLEPSDSVLVMRTEAAVRQSWIELADEGHELAATAEGRRQFEKALCRPLVRACHSHRVVQEQLRLCFIDQLPREHRFLLAAQMRRDRQRCLVCLGTRLEMLPDGPERRLFRARRQQMEEEAMALDRRLADLGLLR
jgi:hypothetical protein